MKTNIIKIAASALAVLLMASSCEKNFDAQIYDKLSSSNFPMTEADFESYVMQCYIPFTGVWDYTLSASGPFYSYNKGIQCHFNQPSDESARPITRWWSTTLVECNFQPCENWGRYAGDGTPSYLNKIRDITRFTQIVGELEETDKLSADKKKSFIAEVRLIRGITMYYLMHVYGPVPVIVDPALVKDEDALKNWSRPSLDQMCKYIEDDFDFAVGNLPEKQPQSGRYNRDYARFWLMRHCLNEGSHMAGNYQKAYDLYTQFQGGYQLFTNGDNPFKELFYEENEKNSEYIMAMETTSSADLEAKNGNGECILNYVIPMDLAKEGEFENLGLSWSGQCYAVNPKFYDTFEENDLRRACIVTHYNSAWGWGSYSPETINANWYGYIIWKYPMTKKSAYNGADYPLARWADVMLMRAEADVRLHNAVSAEAVDLVNQVRARAGLDGLSADATSSVSAFFDALLMERGHEFFWEGQRKIDLIRFGKYHTIMTADGREPSAQYLPMPNFAMEEAEAAGVTLERYFFRDDYDGPKNSLK